MEFKMINKPEIRRRLNRCLKQKGRPPVKDVEWQYAQNEHWVEDAGDNPISIDALTVNILEHRKLSRVDPKTGRRKLDRGSPRVRSLAISAVLAQEARRGS